MPTWETADHSLSIQHLQLIDSLLLSNKKQQVVFSFQDEIYQTIKEDSNSDLCKAIQFLSSDNKDLLDDIFEWAIEHSSLLISRYKVGLDGKTAFRRLMGKECKAVVVEFGEQVLAKPKRAPTSARKRALRSKWVHGTYIGEAARTNETRNSKAE